MRMRADRLSVAALALAILLIGCNGDSGGGAAVGNAGGLESTSSAMTAEAPAGTCTDSGSTSNVPCIGLASGTTVSFKVLPSPDSGSTSTVPYAALTVECQEADSGSTSTVPCTIFVKKR